MVAIEARRFARHPVFLVGLVAAYVVTWLVGAGDGPHPTDILALPVIPAFFIGLTGLVVAARLTRSTEVAVEAMAAAPGSEARRTLAVAGACLLPFGAGLVWLAEVLLILAVQGDPHPNELYLGTLDDLQVWAILVGLGPVACLGGALLGVVTGRWLRFPGATAVVVVALVGIDMASQSPWFSMNNTDTAEYRLWAPWAEFHGGTMDDGRQWVMEGNAAFYVLYQLALCALAVGGAVWHDRTARTARLRLVIVAFVVAALGLLALAMFTGPDTIISDPLPFAIG